MKTYILNIYCLSTDQSQKRSDQKMVKIITDPTGHRLTKSNLLSSNVCSCSPQHNPMTDAASSIWRKDQSLRHTIQAHSWHFWLGTREVCKPSRRQILNSAPSVMETNTDIRREALLSCQATEISHFHTGSLSTKPPDEALFLQASKQFCYQNEYIYVKLL